MTDPDSTAADLRWLAATWPFVRQYLPPPPCRVLDLGCGPLGGFVPALRAEGFDAEGVDPAAPAGPHYHQVLFEEYDARQPASAIVASTSLHHVSDLDTIVDLITQRLDPSGHLVVMEGAWERLNEVTARWCFDRLADDEPGWLHRRRDEWLTSGQSWDVYFGRWARSEGFHTGRDILRSLATRFDTRLLAEGTFLFPDLDGVSTADEQAAIPEIEREIDKLVGPRRAAALRADLEVMGRVLRIESTALLTMIEDAIPRHTLVLRAFAVRVAEAAVAALRRDGTNAGLLAAELNDLAIRLGEVASLDRGLAVAQEATTINRHLAQLHEEFVPFLAASLNNLSVDPAFTAPPWE